MSEQPGRTRASYWMLMALIVLGGIPLLLFLPLLLSNAEISIFGTEHIAQFFRALGLSQFLRGSTGSSVSSLPPIRSSGCAVCKFVGEGFFNGIFGADEDGKKSAGDDEVNSLWRQGYGYNNPNPARTRKGLPAEGF